MKPRQLIFAGIFFLLTSSCVSSKHLIAVQIVQPSSLDTDMQGAIENEVYEAFSHASSRRIAGVQLPDASTFSDAVLQRARIRKIKYITIISDTWISTDDSKEGYKAHETCTLGFRVRVFDVRGKKMILNSNVDGTGFHEPDVYPMSEYLYRFYEPSHSLFNVKPLRHRVSDKSALEKAFDSALADLRYMLQDVVK